MPEKLTDRLVKSLKTTGTDYRVIDDEVRGFAVCVYASGSRAFALDYRIHGRRRMFTIGRWPEWNVYTARERAKAIRRDVDNGIDPIAQRETALAAPRVADLIERYIAEHLPRLAARNASDQASMLRTLVAPHWKDWLVTDVTSSDVERVLGIVAAGRARPAKAKPKDRRTPLLPPAPTPVRANRTGEVLRKMFGLAVKWKMRDDNPAASFHRRVENERERFLSAEEVIRLAAALQGAKDQRAAAVVRMCMLTGARLGEVRMARFDQFNLELGAWAKPASTTKQRRTHRLPISSNVATIVRQRQRAVPEGCPWLFPGATGLQPLAEIRGFWSSIQTLADLPGVRVHDLRHTFASLLINGGSSLEMIGKLLGHSQAKTTKRYAHLLDSPLRAGVQAVADAMEPRLKVVGSTDDG